MKCEKCNDQGTYIDWDAQGDAPYDGAARPPPPERYCLCPAGQREKVSCHSIHVLGSPGSFLEGLVGPTKGVAKAVRTVVKGNR